MIPVPVGERRRFDRAEVQAEPAYVTTTTMVPPPPVPPPAPEPQGSRSDLRAITGDGVAFSLMVGAGETYIPAFALAVQAGETAAGLVSALPLLGGALLQLVSPWAIERLKSHRRWVVLCATIQAMSFAPLALGALLGRNDENLRLLEAELALRIVARGNEITLRGDERQVARGARIVEELLARMNAGLPVQASDVRAALRVLADDADADLKSIFLDAIPVPSRKKQITPKTLNQKRYVEAIRGHDIVVGIGPAGTGKSYLAMAMAVSALTRREVSRIILTRPAVEAGERLGFLPGDMYEKVHPYLRPLYDALYDMMEPDKAATMTERGAIEIAPLAYMRGRTLNDAFIVLDEAQNTTSEQMKMFLTRLGFNSRMVITGDITQVDLPSSRASGLIEIQSVLKSVAGIRFVYFTEKDVVRHELVSEIVRAYDEWSRRREP